MHDLIKTPLFCCVGRMEKLDERVCLAWPLEIVDLSSSSCHRSLLQSSLTLSETSAGFPALESNQDIGPRVRKTFKVSLLSKVVDCGNFAKFFHISLVEFLINHASQNFWEQLDIEGFRWPCHIRVYCSMVWWFRKWLKSFLKTYVTCWMATLHVDWQWHPRNAKYLPWRL